MYPAPRTGVLSRRQKKTEFSVWCVTNLHNTVTTQAPAGGYRHRVACLAPKRWDVGFEAIGTEHIPTVLCVSTTPTTSVVRVWCRWKRSLAAAKAASRMTVTRPRTPPMEKRRLAQEVRRRARDKAEQVCLSARSQKSRRRRIARAVHCMNNGQLYAPVVGDGAFWFCSGCGILV